MENGNGNIRNGGERVSVVDLPISDEDEEEAPPAPTPAGQRNERKETKPKAPVRRHISHLTCPEVRINSKPYSKSGKYGSSHWANLNHDAGEDRHKCSASCVTTALHEAAKEGNAEQVELLLDEGAVDPNSQDCLGRTALHYAVKGGQHQEYFPIRNYNNSDRISTLFIRIAYIFPECNCDACIAGAEKCVRLLVESPRTDINMQDSNGDTALHVAAENQSTKCASVLLYSGADVSIK
jgi:hypothetical protein